MNIYIKIGLGILLLVIVFMITIFPAWFPFRFLEPIFYGSCSKILNGEISQVQKTEFIGLGGTPVRSDYVQCGVDLAVDANRICYVVPQEEYSYGENPLGNEIMDDCQYCEYGSENIKLNKQIIGKQCRPYRILWRWVYEGNF